MATIRNERIEFPKFSRTPWRCIVSIFVLMILLLSLAGHIHARTARMALVLEVEGPIGPAIADFVTRGLDAAAEDGAAIIVLQLDTPGGLDTSMRVIIREILASPIPVVGYVAPSGAHAASAGTYILYAAHVAAMAPGTNIGAATPVQIGSRRPRLPTPQDGESGEEPSTPGIEEKAVSDAVAYIRSLAQLRGRNVEWAERAVREAASLSAADALAERVVDIVAADISDLMAQLDGRFVALPAGRVSLATQNTVLNYYEPDWRTRFLSIITNPNVAYILMLIGIYGLVLEFYNPGVFVAGITGIVSLLLALYAFQLLPVNYAGLALLGLGIALMVAEALLPSFGVLGIGGAIAFILGSIMLLDTDMPGLDVSPVLIGSIAAVSAGLFLFVMMMLMRARTRPVVTGLEEMVGSRAEIVDWTGTKGHVRAHGELWKALGDQAFQPGQTVRVAAVDGLTLTIQPIKKEDAQ